MVAISKKPKKFCPSLFPIENILTLKKLERIVFINKVNSPWAFLPSSEGSSSASLQAR